MGSTTTPAIHRHRFEFRIFWVCLLACVGIRGLAIEGQAQDLAGDRQALIAFFNATGGAKTWRSSKNWLSDELLHEWYGVDVDGKQDRVVGLSLSSNQLTGSIPAELGNLSSLVVLSLSSNQLTGSIPAELGNLSSLRGLYLSNNHLTGSIPAELGNLSSLVVLSLSSNQLTGSIPAELGNLSRLRQLYLSNNQLTGSIPAELGNLSRLWKLSLYNNQLTGSIPAELGNFSTLEVLDLYNNRLTGSIPAELVNRSSKLRALDLSNNQLTGSIPAELGLGIIRTTLRYLRLDNNRLTGSIPAELGSLGFLRQLYLYNNQLTGSIPAELGNLSSLTGLYLYNNQLTGSIPAELGNLSRLRYLRLYNNRLTGSIPAEWRYFRQLSHLDLSRNQLTGSIPAELGLGNIRISLVYLDLSNNQLTGPIPPGLVQFYSLGRLDLSRNRLTGSIPAELGNIRRSLVYLDLSNNQLTGSIPAKFGLQNIGRIPVYLSLSSNRLTGSIPAELGNLSNLTSLSLSSNRLTGSIPAELGNLSSLTSLSLSSNRLTGSIPAELGNLSSLTSLSLSSNRLTGSIPAELGNLSLLRTLHLQHNQLTRPIPPELGQLSNLEAFSFRGNRLTGPVPAGLSHLPDVYLLNLRATWAGPGRIKAAWDDPGDPEATYQYRLWHRYEWTTGWAAIEDPETMLTRGEGVRIEWMLTGLDADADYDRIEIRVSNASGHSSAEAAVTAPGMSVAPDPEVEKSLFVPVLLTSAGRNNAFFTSELTLTNRGTEEATLHYAYTAHRGGGSGSATDTLAPGRQRIQPDAIDYLESLGIPIPDSGNRVGTLRVGVSGSSGVSVLARTTTAVPEGRAGLAYPGIAREEGFQEAVYLGGLRQDTQDRSNVAFQHMGAPGEGPITLRTTLYSGEADDTRSRVVGEVELQPGEFHQYSGLLARLGSAVQGYVKVEKVEGEAPFYAYGVINDNFNSDGSFVFPLTASSLVGTTGQTLPVIIETEAFQSELILTNFSPVTKTVNFRFVAYAIANGTAEFSLTLEAGEQTLLPNLVDHLRRQGVAGIGPAGPAFVGPLFATPAGGDMSGIVIGARTGSPDNRGGQYGLFYNGAPYGSASVDSAWIYGLQQNEENRSNLALVNTGEIDLSTSNFEITVYNGSGDDEPRTRLVSLGPRRWLQINGVLGYTSQGYVQVRKTSGNNPFVAYGVINDGGAPGQRSGDGAFLPAQE